MKGQMTVTAYSDSWLLLVKQCQKYQYMKFIRQEFFLLLLILDVSTVEKLTLQ